MMFITLEGPDGSGKTTQVEPLADAIRDAGYDLVVTREPGGTLIGDQVRRVIMDLKNTKMYPEAEILLFQASRAQLVREVIQPTLAEGKIVLCDRYADSTLAYQGYGHQTDLEELKQIIRFATGGLTPDLTVYLDIDPEDGLRRRQGEGEEWNRLDAYELTFHQRVREGYHQMIAGEPERWVKVDAAQSAEKVQAAVQEAVIGRLKARA
ncbi:MAG: dTMP kinase [Anaerolineae bacterium]|nr:dTMP kinase [Anaerolineae bacterium]